MTLPCKQRYKITIEYDGSNYCGFQRQNCEGTKTIEESLEEAIFKLTNHRHQIICAGRTDAGVHALGQVVHVDLPKIVDPFRIQMALNHYLSDESIVALKCEMVDQDFHARFDAKTRHYRYILVNRSARPILKKHFAYHFPKKISLEEMIEASKFFLGLHDFSSFRDAQCQSSSPIRTISKIEILRNGDELYFDLSAKSFLHHMVRNIVGTLLWVGEGRIKANQIKRILEAKDRRLSGPNVPAHGLYFVGVDY